MTREEAAEFTRKLVARAETIVFPKTPKTINNIPVFYFEAVLSALCGPQPDPDTGLKGCLFCKAMDDYKALQIDPAFAYKYTVAIVSRLYKAGNPRARSTSTYYGNGKYVLNYCPMCGRKLEGRQ